MMTADQGFGDLFDKRVLQWVRQPEESWVFLPMHVQSRLVVVLLKRVGRENVHFFDRALLFQGDPEPDLFYLGQDAA